MSSQPFFFNLHIPKCGGTTFQTILYRNFRSRYEAVYNLIWEDPYTADQLAFFVDDSPGYDCLSSHRLSLDLPFGRTGRELVALSFVRDPVDRMFSHYFYERNRKYERRRYAALRDMTPAQFVDYVFTDEGESYLFDYQFRHLTRKVAEPSFERIEALVASGQLLLLPLERFDEALLVLRALFPREFGDLRYVRRNASVVDHAIDDALREQVRARMNIDLRLHETAGRQLDAKIGALFASREAFDRELATMRRQCRNHERFAVRPTNFAKRVFGRFGRMLGA